MADVNEIPESGLHLFCLGYAAENKPRSTNDLKIFPAERIPFAEGELNAATEEVVVKGVDKEGNAYELSATRKNYITASWKRGDSNRMNAPDIRRGERIEVWRYGDTDIYLWNSLGRDEDFDKRRLETITVALSNRREETDEPLTEDERWLIEASTHDKHITIKTTKSDGEPFAYTVQLNLAEGQFHVTDDIGNLLHINSAENEVLMRNADNTFIQAIKKVINMHADDDVNITTKRYSLKATDSISMETKVTSWLSSETIDVETQSTNWDSANQFTATTVTFTINGNLVTTGTSTLNGAVTMSGGFASSGGGGGSVAGGMKLTGGLEVDGKNVGAGHTHANGGAGPVN